jgi:hypothetical protein
MADQARVDKAPGPTFVGDVTPQTAGFMPVAGDSWCDTASLPYQLKVWNTVNNTWTFCGYYTTLGQEGGPGYVAHYTTTDKLNFTTQATSTLAGTMSNTKGSHASGESSLSGYFIGGYNSGHITTIDKLIFSSETGALATSNMQSPRYSLTGYSSSTKTYGVGGRDTGFSIVNTVEALTFSSEATAIVGTLPQNIMDAGAGSNSQVGGYQYGGSGGGVFLTTISKLTFSGETTANLTSGLPANDYYVCPTYLADKCLVCGGRGYSSGVSVNTIRRHTFSTDTVSSIGNALPAARDLLTDTHGPVAGFMCGGYHSDGFAYKTIIRIDFNSELATFIGSQLSENAMSSAGTQAQAN